MQKDLFQLAQTKSKVLMMMQEVETSYMLLTPKALCRVIKIVEDFLSKACFSVKIVKDVFSLKIVKLWYPTVRPTDQQTDRLTGGIFLRLVQCVSV